ncbi:MAG: DNA adenine methylase [Tannerellaceae bacterium]
MRYSPLRYPGGKNKLSAFIASICRENGIDMHYIEPYSGGASVALFLLIEGFVNKITINDKDRSIYAFWYSVLNFTDELCLRILQTDISIEQWRKQKDIQLNKEHADLLDLGFSTFYLNRTNRSGIITGGIIGGIAQDGRYLMDCRFNKSELVARIKLIANYRDRINLYDYDALDLINLIENDNADQNKIFYFDPPYYYKASSLYMNHYKFEHHKIISDRIKQIENICWIVSYDNVPEIKALYECFPKKEYSFKHTAHSSRVGNEILFFSPNLELPKINDWDPLYFKLHKTKTMKDIRYKVKKITHENSTN